MSSPAGGSGDKPPVLSRFIRRASKAIRPRSTRSSADTIEPATESRTVTVPRPSAATRAAPLAEHQISSAASYMKLREEKARALFAKYGMTLDSAEWSTPVPPNGTPRPEWIEKRIVLRVHRRCHRCQTSFGPDKTCSNCQHPRCKKCPRFPTKRSKDQRPGGEKYDPMAALTVDTAYKGRGNMLPITMPRDGKRDAVRKHPVHRVRRTCHRCETIFQGQATVCEKCKHQRCPQCPRDPPKLKKWPEGYPGDIEETFPLALRVPKPVRTRYRWECHECRKPFIEHQKTCGQCQHERCDDCPRKPPKKVKKMPDPDVVRSVEEKMAALGLEAGSEAA